MEMAQTPGLQAKLLGRKVGGREAKGVLDGLGARVS